MGETSLGGLVPLKLNSSIEILKMFFNFLCTVLCSLYSFITKTGILQNVYMGAEFSSALPMRVG